MLRTRLAELESCQPRLLELEQLCAVLTAEVAEYRRQEAGEGRKEQEEGGLKRSCEQEQADEWRVGEALSQQDQEAQRNYHLLEAIAIATNALLATTNFDQVVNIALQILGKALNTDRVNIIENFDPLSNSAFPGWRALEYEWNSADTVPQFANQQAAQGSYEEIPEIFERLHQGQALSYLIEEAPEPFRSAQIAIGAKSTHLVPIFVEGQWWGVLGIDDCREAKQRSATELSVLRIAADCIGSVIQRQRTQQALLEVEQVRTIELAKANEELQQREHEVQRSYRLLSVVAQVTKDLLENSQVEAAITYALQSIGEAAGISRMMLMQEKPEVSSGRLQHCVIQEWDASGTPRQMDDPVTQAVYNDEYGALINELYAGQSIWRVIEDFPEPARAQQISIGVKSTGAVPIFIEGVYFGCVAFDDCRTSRNWTQQEIDVLTSGAGAIGAALHRQQLVDRLVAERVQAEQERAAELAKANEALARASERLVNQPDLAAFLNHIALEAIAQLGADAAMLSILDEQRQVLQAVAHVEQDHIPVSTLAAEIPMSEAGFINILLENRKPRYFDLKQDAHLFWPGAIAYHYQRNHQAIMGVPLFAGETFLGHLGLAFTHTEPIKEQSSELLYALAQQAALAIQLTKLAEEVKQAAIAREQERATQERAAELKRANDALQTTVSALANRRDLDGFIGEVLHTIAREFKSPLVEYWKTLATDTVEVDTWLCQGELLSLKQGNEHPSRGGIRLLPEFVDSEDFTHRTQVLIFDQPMPAYSLALGRVVCPTEWYAEQGVSKHFNFPLQSGETTVGSISVWLPSGCQITEDNQSLGQALSHQTALAIQLTQLAEEAKQAAIAREQERAAQERAAELVKANKALKRSLDSLASEPNLDKFLGHVLRVVAEQLDAPLTEYWYHPEPNNLAYVGLIYWQGQILGPAEQPGHPGAFGYPVPPEMIHQESLHYRRSYFINDDIATSEIHIQIAHESGLDAGAWYEQYGVSRFLNVPLILGDKTIGALIVFLPNDRHFTELQIELTYALAQQVTLAIQLTRLAEEAKQAAIAREQEKAAQARAAELAKANEALRRSLDQLANDRNLDSFLGHILCEAMQVLDGATAQLFLYDTASETITASFGVDEQGGIHSAPGIVAEVSTALSFPAKVWKGWTYLLEKRCPVYFDVEQDQDYFLPDYLEYHRHLGHCGSVCTALILGDEPLGFLGLVFRNRSTFNTSEFEFFQALANQATLAIQLTKLAEEAKQAAISREQEKAAQERAAELAKANEALKRSLDALATDPDLDLDRFIGHVLKVVVERLGAPVSEYWSSSENTAYLELSCWHGEIVTKEQLHHDPRTHGIQIPLKMVAYEKLNQRQRHFIVENLASDPIQLGVFTPLGFDLKAWCETHRVRHHLNVPLQLGDYSIGALVVYIPATQHFTTQQIELTYALAQQITLAIQLTQLAEEAKQVAIAREQEKATQAKVAELAKTNEALRASLSKLADEPSLQKFLGHLLMVCTEQFGAIGAGIWRYEDEIGYQLASYENGIIRLPSTTPTSNTYSYLKQMPEDSDAYAQLSQGAIVAHHEADLQTLPIYRPYQQDLQRRGIKTLLLIPICLGRLLRGSLILRFDHNRTFNLEEAELAHALANQAALALELTQLAEEAKQAAIFEERNRLAGEIHDTLAQAFTGISVQLELAKFLSEQNPAEVIPILDHIGELAQTGLAEARRSVWTLYSTTENYEDLAHKLSQCLTQMTVGTSLHTEVKINGAPYPFPPLIGKNLLRIGQEAITNALKYAQATHLLVTLTYTPEWVVLSVQDDGCGFDTQATSGGFGLVSMSERADRINGQLTIMTQPGSGTEIRVAVSLS